MGHRVERIESVQRAETSRELIADAVALVDKWNVDIERRKDFLLSSEVAQTTQFLAERCSASSGCQHGGDQNKRSQWSKWITNNTAAEARPVSPMRAD